jgi:hypothetical protein
MIFVIEMLLNNCLGIKCESGFRKTNIMYQISRKFVMPIMLMGYVVVQLVEALRYNSEGCGFYSQWVIGTFY